MSLPSIGRSQYLQLYRELLRYGRSLVYTDKDYYYARIRKEFTKSRELSEEDQLFNYKKGLAFLQRKRLL
ncbi:hypothetical protein CHUAL_004645 [Chamberlinius hualienensis]